MHLKPDSRPGGSPVAGGQGTFSRSGISQAAAADAYDAELRLIAEQAQMLTLASGAAIALRQGELMVCRARAGEGAPGLGALLDTQSGLSGECVRTAKTLVCDDTEKDSRVNLDVCRYLGIRSMAVLPIRLEQEIVGVFETFSAHPGAFSANEVAALESMRDLVISVIRPAPPQKTAELAAPAWRANGAGKAAALPHPAEEKPLPSPPPTESNAAPNSAAEDEPLDLFAPLLSGPEDDLLREIQQRPPAEPEAEKESLRRALELLKISSAQAAAAPPRPAWVAKADPDDDLMCEIEMRAAPAAFAARPHDAHAFSGFIPAAARPPEHAISRKLMAAGVVVALAGLLWLGWCNHAQRASNRAPRAHSPQVVAATPAPPAATPVATPTAPSSLPPADNAAVPESSPELEALSSPEPAPAARTLEPAVQRQARAVSILRRQGTPPPPRAKTRENEGVHVRRAITTPSAKPTPAPLDAGPLPQAGQSAPPATPVLSSTQTAELRPAAVAASPPPVSSPPVAVPPAPAATGASKPAGQLSLSQAVVTAAPESPTSVALSHDALRLLLDSAAAGDGGAQLALAVRYANGEGVRQSYPEALKWFSRAQTQGVVPRQGKALEAWNKVQLWAQSHPQKR